MGDRDRDGTGDRDMVGDGDGDLIGDGEFLQILCASSTKNYFLLSLKGPTMSVKNSFLSCLQINFCSAYFPNNGKI
jgi:hypothetical protein